MRISLDSLGFKISLYWTVSNFLYPWPWVKFFQDSEKDHFLRGGAKLLVGRQRLAVLLDFVPGLGRVGHHEGAVLVVHAAAPRYYLGMAVLLRANLEEEEHNLGALARR